MITFLNVGQFAALVVEAVNCRFLARLQHDLVAIALCGFLFDQAQCGQCSRRGGADKARTFAMRALACRCLQNAGAQTLTAHFHQAEARDTTDLNPGPVMLQGFLHRTLDFAGVRMMLHIDKVDDNQTGHVAQTQLTGNFACGFKVGRKRGGFDAVFFCRPAGVDVDRYQRFGWVDHDITARFQLYDRLIHGVQLVFDMVALEQGHRVGIMLHTLGMAWHQQLHEILGGFIPFRTFDEDFLDILIIDIADGALDQVTVGVDQHRRSTAQRALANFIPQTREIIEVALDFRLGAGKSGGADDAAHGRWQGQVGNDRLQTLPVGCTVDLAADATTMRGVGHQYAIAACKAEIGGQSCAFIAALFLDHLHQQNLTAVDNVLNLVPAAQVHALGADLIAGFWSAAFATIATTTSTTTAVVA